MADATRYDAVKRILLEALEVPPASRDAFLDERCEADAALREEVASLLDHHAAETNDALSERLASGIGRQAEALLGDGASPPTQIGQYRILGILGEGGMGVVYEAEQQTPRRRVALKVVRGGHFVDELRVKLFQREVETLGRMKHAGIAAIYESGQTPDGQHFFAMELVRGKTLSEYLDEPTTETPATTQLHRLRLFLRITEAVHYAHQRGVIHRDLKPSNIIVLTVRDDSADSHSGDVTPRIKILDFGLARITDADVAGTVLSEVGSIRGTLPYMSPEQARGDPADIDVRSDVYSLGVLLYEMIADRPPYDVRGRSVLDAARIIVHEPPERLSTADRRVDPDLVTIVGKALSKSADERYDSAAALGEDVRRFLAREPILARPPSTLYQLRKLVARNRGPFVVAVALVVFLVGFAIAMSVLYSRAETNLARAIEAESEAAAEARTSRHVSDFLIDLFAVSNPGEARGNTITAREILDEGAERIRTELAGEPIVQAELMGVMADVYGSLGLYDPATSLAEGSLERLRDLHGPSHADVAIAMRQMADLYISQGKLEEGERLAADALAVQSSLPNPSATEMAKTRYTLAGFRWQAGDTEAAKAHVQAALTELEASEEADTNQLATLYDGLGIFYAASGNYVDAEENIARALDIRRQSLPADHPDVAVSYNNIGMLHRNTGQTSEAERELAEALAIRERILEPNHPDIAMCLNNLGLVYADQDRHDEAVAVHQRSLRIREIALGADHPLVAETLSNIAWSLRKGGGYGEADSLYARVLAIREKVYGPDHPSVGETLRYMGEVRRHQNRLDEADDLFARALPVLESSLGPDHPYVADASWSYATLHQDRGRFAEAEACLTHSLRIYEAAFGPSYRAVSRVLEDYAELLERMGRSADADSARARAASARALAEP